MANTGWFRSFRSLFFKLQVYASGIRIDVYYSIRKNNLSLRHLKRVYGCVIVEKTNKQTNRQKKKLPVLPIWNTIE